MGKFSASTGGSGQERFWNIEFQNRFGPSGTLAPTHDLLFSLQGRTTLSARYSGVRFLTVGRDDLGAPRRILNPIRVYLVCRFTAGTPNKQFVVSCRRGGYQPPAYPGSIRRDGGFCRRAVREAGPCEGVLYSGRLRSRPRRAVQNCGGWDGEENDLYRDNRKDDCCVSAGIIVLCKSPKAQEESKVENGQNSVDNKQSKRKNCLKKLEMPGNLC